MQRPTLRRSTRNSRMKSRRGRRVSVDSKSEVVACIAWEMLVKKMEKMNLSEAE